MNFSRNIFYLFFLTIVALITNVNSVYSKKQDAKCLLPLEPGPCRMSLNRFYYNALTDTCEEFKFGGCKGNDNKFGFKQTCEEACKKSTSTGAVSSIATTPTVDKNQMTSKHLNVNTLKTLTSVDERTTSTTTTAAPKPTTTRTTVKSIAATTPRSKPTTTQQSKTLT